MMRVENVRIEARHGIALGPSAAAIKPTRGIGVDAVLPGEGDDLRVTH